MKPLKNYENLYYITDDLKIFSVARKGTSGNEIIPQMNTENGYLRVGLSKDNKRKKVMLHRIIAENFISNPYNYTTVDHINGNKLDNRVENLQIVIDDSIDPKLIMQTLLLVLRLMFMELQIYHVGDDFSSTYF